MVRGKNSTQDNRRLSIALWCIIGASLLVHVVSLLLGQTVLADWRWTHHPVHSAVEMAGAVIALAVAWLLITLERRDEGCSFNVQIAAALIGMGVLDGLHALVHAGNCFVWLHSTATFAGGLLFALVWLPRRWPIWHFAGWPVAVLVGTLVFGSYSLALPHTLPAMVHDGAFSFGAMSLNVGGGLLLLIAAVRLILTWRSTGNIDDLLFCLHCGLFGAAAIMFEQSKLWDVAWWGWHLLRLMAYAVALWFVVLTELREHRAIVAIAAELKVFNATLEERVTERTEALESACLKAEDFERRFRSIFDSASTGLLLVEQAGTVSLANRQLDRLFGYAPGALIGQPVEILTPQLIREQHVSLRDAYFASPTPRYMGEGRDLMGVRKDGSTFPLEIGLCPIQVNDSVCVLASVIDLTERKRSERDLIAARDEAQAANRAKSQFLANMSHEIRTPMNAVIGLTEVVLRTDLEVSQRDHLRTVLDSAESLLSIINDILDFSKIEAGKLDVEEVPFDLHNTVSDTLRGQAVRADFKGLELACFIDPALPVRLLGDHVRLRQVLTNLVSNAIKFTEDGEVVVRVGFAATPPGVESAAGSASFRAAADTDGAAATGNCVVVHFSVTDTGIGISSDHAARIFEPFSQADASTTRRYGGTGLGLSICRQLVELMGGKILVSSEPDEGSTFSFTLPFKITSEEQPRRLPALRPLSETRILVVDDNETNCAILNEVLLSRGVQPVIAHSVDDALRELSNAHKCGQPFQLLLSDVHMPGRDGFELVQDIRRDRNLDDLAIILLTSACRSGDSTLSDELHVAGRLMKPVSQPELFAVVERVLGVTNSNAVEPNGAVHVSSGVDETPRVLPLKILLTEDSRPNQLVARAILSEHNHEVIVAENGLEALELLEQQQFDVVFMDLQMPEMDGIEATTRIRQREFGTSRHQQIIAMTAHAIQGDREQCLQAGMDDYVSKPIRREDVFHALAASVERSRRLQHHVLAADRQPQTAESSCEKSASDERRAVDWSGLLGQLGDDRNQLREITQCYLEETAENLQQLPVAISGGRVSEVLRLSHTIKGAMQQFGATEAMSIAQRLEQLAGTGSVDGAAQLAADLEQAVRPVIRELQLFVDTGQL